MVLGFEHLSIPSELRRVTIDAGVWPHCVYISLISTSFIMLSFQSNIRVLLFFKILTQGHLFIAFREREREEGRERNIDVREKHQLVASHIYNDQGLNLQPRYVPQLGTEPATSWLWEEAPTN